MNVGENITALAYDKTYGGSEVKLVFKPFSIYGEWGTEVTSNVITVSVTDNVLINGASFVYTTDSITYNGWVRTVY